jgi:hypothetical protein
MRFVSFPLVVLALLVASLAGCTSIGPQPTPVAPTKTPKPTFTPTPDWTPTPVVFATVAPVAAAPTADAAAPAQPESTAQPEATEAPAPAEPTAEPPPAENGPVARLTANQTVNIRSGPGTNYGVVGRLTAGQAFPVTGKNARGDWYQFDFDGQSAWVVANLVNVNGDPAAVPLAQNIPAPPTPRPTARPQPRPTSPPAPPAPPQPTAAPVRRYEFNVAIVQKCDRQPAGNWFDGTVYKGGQPFNGARVVFSYAPDGPWASDPMISGPHDGYPGWNTGYYSHIINAAGPQAGNWYVWLVDGNGARISEMANWQSTGPGDGCNQATVDFDSR